MFGRSSQSQIVLEETMGLSWFLSSLNSGLIAASSV